MLIQMERQIDREIAADQRLLDTCEGVVQDAYQLQEDSDSEMEDEQPVLMYGPLPQIVTNDLKSLDEMVSLHSAYFYPVLKKNCVSVGRGLRCSLFLNTILHEKQFSRLVSPSACLFRNETVLVLLHLLLVFISALLRDR